MTTRNRFVALAALAAFAGLAAFLQGRATPTSATTDTASVEEVTKLRAAFDKVALQNKDLTDQILKLRREHEAVRDDHTGKIGKLREDVDSNKKLAADNLADLKKFFQDQNLRVEWKSKLSGISENGQDTEVDFGKPVVEAVAMVAAFHVRYPKNDDHNVRQVIADARVVDVKGTKVKVRCRCYMDDNSGNHSDRYDILYVVIARIKS